MSRQPLPRVLVLSALLVLIALPLRGQSMPDHVLFWLGAGPARSDLNWSGIGLPFGKWGAAAVATVQSHRFVLSARTTLAGTNPVVAWDVGVLAGIGTSTAPAVYGSAAVGIGYVTFRGRESGMSVPLELQLGWRLTPSLGLGLYGFGSLAGPQDFLGLSLGVRIGRLR